MKNKMTEKSRTLTLFSLLLLSGCAHKSKEDKERGRGREVKKKGDKKQLDVWKHPEQLPPIDLSLGHVKNMFGFPSPNGVTLSWQIPELEESSEWQIEGYYVYRWLKDKFMPQLPSHPSPLPTPFAEDPYTLDHKGNFIYAVRAVFISKKTGKFIMGPVSEPLSMVV